MEIQGDHEEVANAQTQLGFVLQKFSPILYPMKLRNLLLKVRATRGAQYTASNKCISKLASPSP